MRPMMKTFWLMFVMTSIVVLSGCNNETSNKEAKKVSAQQDQYEIGQPVPVFDWSLERHLLIQLYSLRNQKAATHSVWRSDYGMIEGDCPSLGYGLPYDTSLTNPLKSTSHRGSALTTIEQAEPNGIFASKNTTATFVMCVGDTGALEPMYIESKVTAYPGPVNVDYKTNRVKRIGPASVTISKQ